MQPRMLGVNQRFFALKYLPVINLFLCLLLLFTLPTSLFAQPTKAPQDAITKTIMADERFLYEPQFTSKEIQAFLNQHPGVLKHYETNLGDLVLPAAQIIDSAAFGMTFNNNPKIILTLLEMRYHLISDAQINSDLVYHPLGLDIPGIEGFQQEIIWMAAVMRSAYSSYGDSQTKKLKIGNANQFYDAVGSPNAGTFAIQTALGRMAHSPAEFLAFIGEGEASFVATYQRLFEDPRAPHPQPLSILVKPFLAKPFAGSYTVSSFFDHDSRAGYMRRFDGATRFSYEDHRSIDFSMPSGTPILAAATGKIRINYLRYTEGNPAWCWNMGVSYSPVIAIGIQHVIEGVEFQTYYWHLSKIAKNPRTGKDFAIGDQIEQGETLGYAGNTGCSTGPHLHFSVSRQGFAVDPFGWCGPGNDPWPAKSQVLWAQEINPSPCPSIATDVWVEAPKDSEIVYGKVKIKGWSIDTKANEGTGITKIFLSLDGPPGKGGKWIGEAHYGLERPDVVSTFKVADRFRNSGYEFEWDTTSFEPGEYTLYVTAYGEKSGWSPPTTRKITIQRQAPMEIHLDTPQPGAVISGLTKLQGWAADLAAAKGTGINSVHFYLDGPAGEGQLIGTARYGLERSDLVEYFGSNERLRYAGYSFDWNTSKVAPGQHKLFVYVQSVSAGWVKAEPIVINIEQP